MLVTLLKQAGKKIVCILFWLLLSSAAISQQDENSSTVDPADGKIEQSVEEEKTATETDSTDDENSEQGTVNEEGNFIPSEEISEDLPVAFPVDI